MGLTDRLIGARRRKVGEIVRGRVLDVGFGTGLSLAHYPPDVEIVGTDASLGMLAYARGTPAMSGRRCTIPDPERAVHEAVRVARPGAPMVFLEHVRSQPGAGRAAPGGPEPDPGHPCRRTTSTGGRRTWSGAVASRFNRSIGGRWGYST